ncbi:hypothetical protein Taro_037089 [Colocasia esculenta]|uniref:Uncharacterized protein n=1 Tax=Colocasia esculenta TaxID=4460 RepID=A0A843WF87_COLES|nr:hypothetical protein [Colocasia esculenta]
MKREVIKDNLGAARERRGLTCVIECEKTGLRMVQIAELIAAILPRLDGEGEVSAEKPVPSGEVEDGVVVLDADVLVVEDVEGGVVGHPLMDEVVREPHNTVVVQRLERQQAEEHYGHPRGHTGDVGGHHGANHLSHKGVHWVGVQSSVGVGGDEAEVHGVNVFVQEHVLVRPAVPKVRPAVHDEHRHRHLPNGPD